MEGCFELINALLTPVVLSYFALQEKYDEKDRAPSKRFKVATFPREVRGS